jgi:CheY-like chemotaxis protein
MILIVASHPHTRDAILSLVAAKNYPIAAIDCGNEILTRLRFQPPALIILDCDLSDSFDMLTHIRADPRGNAIPILMYSETGTNLREKALAQGANAFITKGSLDWAELLTEITRFLGPPPTQ